MLENTIRLDPKFRALHWEAQWLFFTALREGPKACGVVDVNPKRYARLAPGIDEKFIVDQALALDAAGVAVYDHDTDEMFFPGYLTEGTAPKNARKVIAVVNSLRTVASGALRETAVKELCGLRDQTPEAAAWDDERVIATLGERCLECRGKHLPEGVYCPNCGNNNYPEGD